MSRRIAIVAPSLDILGGQGIQAQALIERLGGEGWPVDLLRINPHFPCGLGWVRQVPYARTVLNQALYEIWFSKLLPSFFRDRLGGGTRLGDVGVRGDAVRALLDLYEARHRADHCRQLWGLLVLDFALRRLLEPSLSLGAAR